MVAIELPLPELGEVPNEAAEGIERGSKALAQGKRAKALREYDATLTILGLRDSSTRTHVLWAIGAALRSARRYAEALAYFDRALDVSKDDWQLLLAKGIVLADLERTTEAIAIFDEILQRRDIAEVRDARRTILDEQLRRLVKRGIISWAGGKPDLPKERPELTSGPPLSQWIIESRR